MDTDSNRRSLQSAADRVVVEKYVRASGIGGAIFGVLALFLGVMPPASAVLIVLGSLLSLMGLWNLTNPRPLGIAFVGVCLFVVGLFNIGSGFVENAAGQRPSVFWQVLGVWQLIWGYQAFQRYRRFANSFDAPANAADGERAARAIRDLRRANPKKDRDVIQLFSGGLNPRLVRVRLMADRAFCLVNAGDDVRDLSRGELDLELVGDAKAASPKVRVQMQSQSFVARIPREQLERFEEWKGRVVAEERRAA
jgi:hypothetical protein